MKFSMALLVLATGLIAAPALADPPVQPGSGFALLSASAQGLGVSDFHFGAGTARAGTTNPMTGVTTYYAITTASFSPFPYIELSTINTVNGYGQAHAELTYQYLALLPTGGGFLQDYAYSSVVTISGYSNFVTTNAQVNLVLTASATSAMAQGPANYVNRYAAGTGGGGAVAEGATFTRSGPGQYQGDTVIGGETFSAFIGTIRMVGDVYDVGFVPGTSGYAYLDPVITINPLFLQENGLPDGGLIQLSQGFANAQGPGLTVLPEPGSWALLIAGFAVSGTAMRRRRAIATA